MSAKQSLGADTASAELAHPTPHQQPSTHSPRSVSSNERTHSVLTLQDIGELPASIIATLVAYDPSSLRDLRLSCKAVYGASTTTHSGIPDPQSRTIHTGLSRQTTFLSLSTRVFLRDGTATDAEASMRALTAADFLARHSGVTNLILTQEVMQEQQDVYLQPIPDSLPNLRKLSVYVSTTDDEGEDMEFSQLRIDPYALCRLHCLTRLTLDHCQLDFGLSYLLSHLPLLTKLQLSDSTGIDLLVIYNLSHLKSIGMRSTDVSILLIQECSALISLEADFSRALANFTITGSPALLKLNLALSPLLPCVDLQDCPLLEALEVSNCSALGSVEVSRCSKLKDIQAYSCDQLTALDIMGCCALEILNVAAAAITQLDFTACIALQRLTLHDAAVITLPASPTLKYLDLRDCAVLKTLDPSSYPQLTELDLTSCNALSALNIARLEHLVSIHVSWCSDMTELLVSDCPVLCSVNICSAKLTQLSITRLLLLENLLIASANDNGEDPVEGAECAALQMQVSDCPALHTVSVNHEGVAALDLSLMSCVQELDVSSCSKLVDVRLTDCTSLSALSLMGCSSLQRLDLSGATALTSLNMTDCSSILTGSPQVMNCLTLTSLHLTFDGSMPCLGALLKLHTLHLVACSNLVSIEDNVRCCGILNLTITKCPLLQRLDLTHMLALQRLKVTGCERLSRIGGTRPVGFIPGTRLPARGSSSYPPTASLRMTHVSVSDCPSLLLLDLVFYPQLKDIVVCRCIKLVSLEVQHCPALKILRVVSCPVSSLDLHGAVLLATIELSSLDALRSVNWARCRSLRTLHMTDCRVVHLNFRGCQSLRALHLNSCEALLQVNASGLPSLVVISASECPLLHTLQLSGSTRLRGLRIGWDSPLSPLDLTEASKLDFCYHPADPIALCPLCKMHTVTHGFLHSRIVHRVCSNCAQEGARREEGSPITCPVCSILCQSAIFSDTWY